MYAEHRTYTGIRLFSDILCSSLVRGTNVTNNTETLIYVYTWNSEIKYAYDGFHVL